MCFKRKSQYFKTLQGLEHTFIQGKKEKYAFQWTLPSIVIAFSMLFPHGLRLIFLAEFYTFYRCGLYPSSYNYLMPHIAEKSIRNSCFKEDTSCVLPCTSRAPSKPTVFIKWKFGLLQHSCWWSSVVRSLQLMQGYSSVDLPRSQSDSSLLNFSPCQNGIKVTWGPANNFLEKIKYKICLLTTQDINNWKN